MAKLTELQRECLDWAHRMGGSVIPLEYGNTITGSLCGLGFLARKKQKRTPKTYYQLTDAGREALKGAR